MTLCMQVEITIDFKSDFWVSKNIIESISFTFTMDTEPETQNLILIGLKNLKF